MSAGSRSILASRLEAFMAEHGLTQLELAKRAGLTHSVISRLLSGEVKSARYPTIKRLADALGVSPQQLAEEARDSRLTDPDAPSISLDTTERNREVRLDLGRLPVAGPLLIGRESELARLDAAWEDPGTHVLSFVAFGGTGKSALVSHWLDRMAADGWRGARRVLDWSFYSQGTEDRITSADRFLDYALTWCGDPDPKAGPPRDRGLRLAELVRREKTLLVLDGVEPLQHPPSSPLAGRLKDPGLAALLKSLAAGNPGLCIITTRERIADLDRFPTTAPQDDLEALTPAAGAELLKLLGVQGKTLELLAASKEFGNHALTLTLLGGYLSRACRGDIRRRKEVNLAGADERKGGHALRVIGTYAEWLGEGPELAVLRLLGLFDRPADPKAIEALRATPVIPGLTDGLMNKQWWRHSESASEEAWQLALSNLREHGLLLPADPHQPGSLDAHPLVRVFFQEELQTKRPEAWQAGNLRLYEYLQREAPDLPDTLVDMEPLFTAVIHGCRAGRQQEAFDKVYWRRILRGGELFSLKMLGAYGSDLSALSGFFDRAWDQPSTRLNSETQAFLLNAAGFRLRALGRLSEAIQPMKAGLQADIDRADWRSAAANAVNLGELTLALGEVERGVGFGAQSVDLADRGADGFLRMVSRTALADALHQAGRWEESLEAFREAEALQASRQPMYPRLYSHWGYKYCDLLLSLGEPKGSALDDSIDSKEALKFRESCEEVRERSEQTLEWVTTAAQDLLSAALDHLSLGRAFLGLTLSASPREESNFSQAEAHLNQAVNGLRRAGAEEFIVRGLLARAALRRLQGNLAAADADLSEALEIADRGSMRLHECDAHLEWARLCRQRENHDALKQHVAGARKLVEETGYRRRTREVEWLEKRLAELPSQPRDFFISFTKADRAWADWIAWTLEEAGYKVVYPPRDFVPGSDFALKMQEAASGAHRTVILLSESYLNSGFMEPDWAAAFAESPQSAQPGLIVFRVGPCSPPDTLKTLIFADLIGLPLEEAKKKILRAVSDLPQAIRR